MRILKNNLKYIFCILALGLIIDTSLMSKNTANAEWNSSKPIKVFVGFKPGGRTDVLARLISNYINKNKLMAHPIAIVNKPGAAAANAARAVLKAKPDGHTLPLASSNADANIWVLTKFILMILQLLDTLGGVVLSGQ